MKLAPKFRSACRGQLPPVVKSVQAGSQASFTSSATVTALFAAVESQLLTFVKGLTNPGDNETPPVLDQNSKGYHALLILTYASLFFSISATVSSLILTDEFGELDYRAARADIVASRPKNILGESLNNFLSAYGMRWAARLVKYHWIIMLLLGYFCLVAQLLVYISLAEPMDIRIAAYCLGGFSLAPIILLLSVELKEAKDRVPSRRLR
ncbi:hypothetical protein FRC12_006462 [Ceratobasidium sp. 428]|nr:hypothetical protein FRC12_006462 [Ceratobasidium sp. 428]